MRRIVRASLVFFTDIAAFFVAYVISYYGSIYVSTGHNIGNVYTTTLWDENRLYVYSLSVAIALMLFYNAGHYLRRTPWWSQVQSIIIILTLMVVVDGFIHYAYKVYVSRLWVAVSWLCSIPLILIGRQCAKYIGKALDIWNNPTVVIGNGENAIDSLYALCSDNYVGYSPNAILMFETKKKIDPARLPPSLQNIKIIYGRTRGIAYLKKHTSKFYILAPETFMAIDGEHLVHLLNKHKCRYAIVPPTRGLRLYGLTPQYFFGHDIMLLRPQQKTEISLRTLAKRGIDIGLSSTALLLAAPLFLTIGMIIRADGGKIFFKHKRVGKNGRHFRCLKFRTMVPDAEKTLKEVLKKNPAMRKEWKNNFKIKDDPRITGIGHFLRKTSLDELPQLFNVLIGDMSLVGPRPIVDEEKKYYEEKLSSYLSVRPGITGLWQVSGRSDTTYTYRVYLDNWYTNNWSIWHDMVIILRTVRILFKRAGAY